MQRQEACVPARELSGATWWNEATRRQRGGYATQMSNRFNSLSKSLTLAVLTYEINRNWFKI